jgi:hypothetical protein
MDPRVADFHERAFINHILSTQHPETGMDMYFLSLRPGHFKVFGMPDASFWCCTGTGMENFSKLGDSLYFRGDGALWVNLFFASEVRWEAQGVTLRQETRFPEEPGTTLRIRAERPAEWTLHVRIPYWAEGATVSVNGEPSGAAAQPSSYAAVRRAWRDGDTVRVELPMRLHLHPMPDKPALAAVMYGPLVLAGALGTEGFTADMGQVVNQTDRNGVRGIVVPDFVDAPKALEQWIEPVAGKPLTFRTRGIGRPEDVTLIPLCRLYDQRYTVYWRFLTGDEYRAVEEERAKEKAREAAIRARTVDAVSAADPESESAHGVTGEKMVTGAFRDRMWRHAETGGWFSYELSVPKKDAVALVCTVWAGDANRGFDILVDGTQVAARDVSGPATDAFVDCEYPVPEALTVGKDRITVTFRATGSAGTGGIYACAVLTVAAGS